MKTYKLKLTFLLVAILSIGTSYSQSCDTLRNYNPNADFFTINNANGYLAGNQVLGGSSLVSDWAEPYTTATTSEVRSVNFATARVNDGGGSVIFKVYANNAGEPGAVLGSETVPLADLDELFWNTVEFTTPVTVSGTFFVGYEVSYVNLADTFALLNNSPASEDFTQLLVDGDWYLSGDIYTIDGDPSQNAFIMDVLLSTGGTPNPAALFADVSACVGGSFTVDGSTSENVDIYEWFLTNDPFTTVFDDATSNPATLTPTQSGTHRLYLFGTGSCRTEGVYYLVDVFPAVNATINTTNTTCGGNNGSIQVTNATGGDGTYQYSIDGINYITGNTFSNLASGDYTVYVRTAGNGCTESFSATVNATNPEQISVPTASPVCAGNPVTLTASGNGNIEWFAGATSIGTGTSISVSPTVNTTYTAVLTDGNGCEDQDDVTVSVNPLPAVSAGTGFTVCEGQTITLSGSGATTYEWNNSVIDGQSFIITETTTFTVIGTDNNGCENNDNITVTVTDLDNAEFAYSSGTLCSGGANETPTINSTGTFSSNSTDLVFANTSTGEIDMTASADGSYQVTFTTNGTCPNSSVQTITITSTPEAEFSYSAASYCANEGSISPSFIPDASSGVFTVNVTGLIINATTGVINTNTSSPGVYEVTNTIAASGACPADEHTVSVTIADLPTATITGGTSVCGDASTTVELTVTLTGNGPWDFTYSDGNTSNDVNGQADATYTMTVNTSGTYTITSVSDAGCSNTGTGSAIVAINENPTVSAGADFSVCEGSIINLSGTGATSYTWDNDVINGVDFTIAATTTYTVIGTDNNGCQDSDQITVTVNEIPTVTLTDFANICEDADAIVLTGGNPANGTYTGTGVTGGEFDPSVAGVGTFTITYTFESTEGCSGSTTASITVETCSGAGIDEQSIENLSIFPNPANQNLTVSFFNNKNHAVNVVMLASDGKLIFTDSAAAMNDFNSTIDVTNLSKGVYFIQLQSASGNHVEKVIIQ